MKELNNIKRVVSWNSKKNEDGTFTANAYSCDHNEKTVIHASYTRSSRAIAVNAAKKAVKYLKTQKEA